MLAAVSCGREDVLETMWVSTDIHFTDRMSIEEIEDAKTPAAFATRPGRAREFGRSC